jgi:2-dehydropantoate 2-reductase
MIGARIGIVGAGAIGSSIAAHLAAAGERVSLLARGRRLEALRRDGLRYALPNEPEMRPDVRIGEAAELGVQDVVFTAVKAQSLPELIPQLQLLTDEATTIVPLVNGIPWWFFLGGQAPSRVAAVDPFGALAAAVPADRIVGAVVYMTATLGSDGVARTHAHRRLELGDIDGSSRERTEAIAAMLTGSGLESRAIPDIRDALWTKVALNLATNPLSVVTGTTLSEMFTDPLLQPLVLAVAGEVRAVAAAYGGTLKMDEAQMIAIGRAAGPFKTSMLQDFERGAPLELAAIAGACIELGVQKSIEMPASRAIAALAAHRVSFGPEAGLP